MPGSALCINTKRGEETKSGWNRGHWQRTAGALFSPVASHFSSLFFFSDSFNQHNKARQDFHYGVLAARDGRRVS